MKINELRRLAFERFTAADEIHKKALVENRSMTDAEKTQYESLMTEFKNRQAEVQRETEHEELRKRFTMPEGQKPPADPGTLEFRDIGLWAQAVARKETRAFSMTTGAAGGWTVPDVLFQQIMALQPEAGIVRSRAMVIPPGDQPDAAVRVPYLKQGAEGVYGGMDVTWKAEAGTQTEQTAEVDTFLLEPKEVGDYIVLTDQLLRNSGLMTAFLRSLFSNTLPGKEDYRFLRGNGVGQPKGPLYADCKLNVTRNTATDVKFSDITSMLTKLLPDSWGNAIWVANLTCLPKFAALVDAGSHSIWITGDASKGIPGSLLGIPVRFTGKTPVLGTEGDLMLCDFSKYIIKDGYGPVIATSEHVYFTTNRTVMKGYKLTDGQPWVQAALTLEDGSTQVTPFVVLK